MQNFLEMAARREFLVLDTETTGLYQGEIVEIAIINAHGEELLESYIRPVNGIPEDASKIHGITLETVASAPTWCDVVDEIKDVIAGKDLCVYNAVYDRRMMFLSAEAHGLAKIEWNEVARWHCVMLSYAEFYGEWNSYHNSYRWQSLSAAAQQCGIELKGAHSALGDCCLTLGVINYMLNTMRHPFT
ncbi:MAG: 3'-5' exonuclease [Nitrososphaera sp.]|nr:3'-5' exonuclease [Nitrososphaera sp.]